MEWRRRRRRWRWSGRHVVRSWIQSSGDVTERQRDVKSVLRAEERAMMKSHFTCCLMWNWIRAEKPTEKCFLTQGWRSVLLNSLSLCISLTLYRIISYLSIILSCFSVNDSWGNKYLIYYFNLSLTHHSFLTCWGRQWVENLLQMELRRKKPPSHSRGDPRPALLCTEDHGSFLWSEDITVFIRGWLALAFISHWR